MNNICHINRRGDAKMDKTEFGAIKNSYEQARESERKDLAKYLAKYKGIEDVLRVVSGGRSGKGLKDYTAGKRIKGYDLSNWKWVEVTDDGDFDCIVSLNMPDIDLRSGNPHSLFDRIGLLVFYQLGKSYYETEIYTDIDLPPYDTEKEKIAQLVLDQYKIFKERSKGV